MTIKRRLAVSNVLMILVPVCISVITAAVSLLIVYTVLTHGTGIHLSDAEDFPEAGRNFSFVIEHILQEPEPDKAREFSVLNRVLDRKNVSYVVSENGAVVCQAGSIPAKAKVLQTAAVPLGPEGYISDGSTSMYFRTVPAAGSSFLIQLYGHDTSVRFSTLKFLLVCCAVVLLIVIIISVLLTNRFLIHFVFRKIEQPLDILSKGVCQIHSGNFEYRIHYAENDEFAPVCEDFNEMALQLKKSTEEVMRHEENRKELVAGMSHDLRSPLTSIQAYIEGLLDGVASTPEKQTRYLLIIKEKAQNLARMISELFLFSKMDLNEFPVHIQPVDLAAAVTDFVQTYRDEHEADRIKITAAVEPSVISADPELLSRIFTNIADNSLKYTDKDSCVIHILLRKKDDCVILTFNDNGPGIPDDAADKLFDVFYRCDRSRRDPEKGSGIGLAVAAKAVRRMNGSISARNSPAGGLSVIISFPGSGAG
jgi:signal transduction histidine kinase